MELDGPFLAGFVAGEGHFWIAENNAGQSWACGFALVQRDDNAELVARARDLAGCGEVRWRPPHRTSHAQVHWLVQSMDACSSLARCLRGQPLLGKKAGDLAIWQQAVAAWNDTTQGAMRWKRLERFASELRAHRSPAFSADYTRVDISRPALSGFLAGFASAEGHFGASPNGHPRFVIKLRHDDSAVLALLATRFAVGRLVPVPASYRGRRQAVWLVTRLEELRLLAAAFDRHPPLGRAGKVYRHWRQLVMASERSAAALRPVAARLREARRYHAGTPPLVSPPRRDSKRVRYVAVLRAWAREAGPPYTATSYERWRSGSEPGIPTRNTLARFFGCWRDALAEAGLPQAGSRSECTNARAIETASAARVASRSRRRDAVLREVDKCWCVLGRLPTASEFLRWRLENSPESPGQAELYRLFAGGWEAVLEALPPRGMTGGAGSHTLGQPLQSPAQPPHVPAAPREDLAREPDVQPGSVDQVGHEGVAGHEVAARQRE